MSNMSVRIEGLDNIAKKFESMTKQDLTKKMQKAVALVERSAKQTAPKDTGALRRSITSIVESNSDEVVGTVFTPLEYAPYVEYGTGLFAEEGGRMDVPWNYQDDKGVWHSTSGQKPQPFLRPALDRNRRNIIIMFKDGDQ